MKIINLFLSVLFCIFTFHANAQYDDPNSIAYDLTNKAYYVTNTGDGTVTEIDSNFSTSTVITGLVAPMDIFFADLGTVTVLLIIDDGKIKVYDLSNFSFLLSRVVTGAVSLEDGVFDPNSTTSFYLSDKGGDKIMKGVLGAAPFYPITWSTVGTLNNPTGLLFDSKNRLLVTQDTSNAKIYAIDTTNGNLTTLKSTTLTNLNDISEDGEGNYYVTCWGDDYMYRYNANFSSENQLTQFNDPAGMYVNVEDDYIAIACNGCNKVDFEKLHLFAPLNDVFTCENDSFILDLNPVYSGIGTYNSGNQFRVEMSDSNGSFALPKILGFVSSLTEPSQIASFINFADYGTGGHLLRIRSTSPSFESFGTKTLYAQPTPEPFSTPSSFGTCLGSPVIIGDAAQSGMMYSWTPGTYLNSTTASNPTFSTNTAGDYTIHYTISNSNGICTLSDSVVVSVNPGLTVPALLDTVTACFEDSVSLGVNGITYDFTWSNGQLLSDSMSNNPSTLAQISQGFHVMFSDSSGCTGADSVYLKVNPLPLISGLMDSLDVCAGDTIQLGISPMTGYTYQWNSQEYLNDSTLSNPIFSANSWDMKNYIFNVIDANACVSSENVFVQVHSPAAKPDIWADSFKLETSPFYSYYQWFRNDTLLTGEESYQHLNPIEGETYTVIVYTNDSCSAVSDPFTFELVGVEKVESSFKIYPNPSSEYIIISSNLDLISYSIYNLDGQKILKGDVFSNIDIRLLPDGIYIVELKTNDKNFNSRFVKMSR